MNIQLQSHTQHTYNTHSTPPVPMHSHTQNTHPPIRTTTNIKTYKKKIPSRFGWLRPLLFIYVFTFTHPDTALTHSKPIPVVLECPCLGSVQTCIHGLFCCRVTTGHLLSCFHFMHYNTFKTWLLVLLLHHEYSWHLERFHWRIPVFQWPINCGSRSPCTSGCVISQVLDGFWWFHD